MALGAVCAAVTLLVLPAPAEDPKPKPPSTAEAAKQATQAGDVELLAAAYKLAEIGDKQKSPEALVGAGSLILKLKALTKGEMGELALKPEVQDEKGQPIAGAKVEAAKPESLEEIAQVFFDTASNLGKDLKMSDEVEALIKAAKARKYDESPRGAKGGPKWLTRTIGPHQMHVYNWPFHGHSLASVGVRGSAPLHTKMRTGDRIHFDGTTGVGQYSWVPQGTHPTATISVQNPHNFKVSYQLFSN